MMASKKGLHNELEKKRRSTLNASYARLTTIVKKINPRLAKTKMGRDKTLKIALSQLTSSIEQIQNYKEDARRQIEELKKELFETDNEEDKEEVEKDIGELEAFINQEIVIDESYSKDEELPGGSQEEEAEEEPEGSDEDEDNWVLDDELDHSSSQSCATIDNDDTTHVSP